MKDRDEIQMLEQTSLTISVYFIESNNDEIPLSNRMKSHNSGIIKSA